MLTFNQLASTLAELNSIPVADAEAFLRELFALAAEELESEGAVEVPSIGRFAIMDGNIVYQPDADLAAELNAPFADFEPVELPAGFSLAEEDAEEPKPSENSESSENSEPSEPSEISEPSEDSEPSELSENSENSENPEPEPSEPEPQVIVKNRGVSCCVAVIIGLLGLIAGYIIGYMMSPTFHQTPVVDPITDPVVIDSDSDAIVNHIEYADTSSVADSVEVFVPAPAPLTLDTIRAGRFLTTMARQHYGKKDFWVYIYETNASKLGNPDLLEAGTVVVIPPADSLGLDPGNAEKIAEANRKAQEIYGRFN